VGQGVSARLGDLVDVRGGEKPQTDKVEPQLRQSLLSQAILRPLRDPQAAHVMAKV
jgi:hypothetical protein